MNNVASTANIVAPNQRFESSGLSASPRFTIGRQFNNCWGIQARYWNLRHRDGLGTTGPFQAFAAQPDLAIVSVNDSLEAYIVDLELTRCFRVGDHRLIGTLGTRHASLEDMRDQPAFGQTTGGDAFTLTSLNALGVDGTGVTYSLLASYALPGHCYWSIYSGGRASYVFVDGSGLAVTSGTVQTTSGAASSVNGALVDGEDSLFIGEYQAGLQWARCLRRCRAQGFLRGGFEYQYWDSEGASFTAGATSVAASGQGSGSVIASTTGMGLDRHLVGFVFSAGFSW